MKKGADEAIAISQSFFMEDEFRFSTFSDSLCTWDVGDFSPHENGFEGDFRADVEAVRAQSNSQELSPAEHFKSIGGIKDTIPNRYAHANTEEKLIELVTERNRTIIASSNIAGTLRQDGSIFHFFIKLRNQVHGINVIC